jgi:hypothetical protein
MGLSKKKKRKNVFAHVFWKPKVGLATVELGVLMDIVKFTCIFLLSRALSPARVCVCVCVCVCVVGGHEGTNVFVNCNT